MAGPIAVALFTRDLRAHDNPVLSAAAASGRVVPLFVVDEAITGFCVPNRARFLAESLADLDSSLRGLGARLVIRRGRVVDEVPAMAREAGAATVHVAADVSAYAQHRLAALGAALRRDGRELCVHDAVVTAVAPGAVTPLGGDHFKVFTPYFVQWSKVPRREPLAPPSGLAMPDVRPGSLPSADELATGAPAPGLMAGGELEGRRRLDAWFERADDYGDGHNMMANDATSRLSPYLHFGCVSATEVVHRVGTGTEGARAFVRQVAWRDFHHQVLAARPDASRHDYRPRGDRWGHDEDELDAWRQGRTGFPIVDAAMRQLLREGWLHNRARLIVASFLAKTLYIDWRVGARHFLDHLVDGDVANNQMNWQWMAGTGTDTRPNRVLSTIAQARRYDPDGRYVRRYVPELADVAGLEGPRVHEPWRLDAPARATLDYPEPIIAPEDVTRRLRAARGGDDSQTTG